MDIYNIMLSVNGSHTENGKESRMQFFTEGQLTLERGKYTIEYEESELSGIANSRTRLTIDGDKVMLNRLGNISTEFVFQNQQAFEAAYDTPFGYMSLSVLPTRIQSDITKNSGDISLEYIIKVGEQRAFNKLNIHYDTKMAQDSTVKEELQ